MAFEFTCTTQAENPMSSDNFERAVFRAAPTRFAIEFLPPTRQGGTYSHGMRISKISKGDRSSISSRGSNSEYDIWRRWEDCLWLQDTLEHEYSRAAREKRTRLAQGKGVKDFNGIYKQDLASSWDSLPPGPAPQSVARDVHQYLPHLTKKGTFFRPKPSVVERREHEFQALIEALMGDDVPALVKEIRSSRIITDFFGFWRRDFELEERNRKAYTPRTSITSSVFSSYFSSSHPTLSFSSPESLRSNKKNKTNSSTINERPFSVASDVSTDAPPSPQRSSLEGMDTLAMPDSPVRRRSISVASSGSSSLHSDGTSDSSDVSNPPVPKIVLEQPVKFGHNPQRTQDPVSSILEPLSEDNEVYVKSPLEGFKSVHLKRRPRTAGGDKRSNRNCQVFSSPAGTLNSSQTHDGMRESWQSGASAATFLDGLGFALPNHLKDRASVASISTFMTTDSAEAVIPMTPISFVSRGDRYFLTPRNSLPVSLSDFDMISESGKDDMSILDAFPRPTSYLPEASSRPDTPIGQPEVWPSPRKNPQDLPSLTIPTNSTYTPPSPTSSTFSSTLTISTVRSQTSFASQNDSISIKAVHNSSIIMLKVSRDMSYSDFRQRLYNKFVGQEGVPLSHSFAIFAPPSGSTQATSPALDGRGAMLIDSQSIWSDLATSFDGTKLTLRILNATS